MDRARLSEAKRLLEKGRAAARGRAQPREPAPREEAQDPKAGAGPGPKPMSPEPEPLPSEKRSLKRRIMEALELPGDVVLDVPRIVIIGNFQLAVENHRGLVEYTPERVSIGVARGQLSITGQGLAIGTISGEEITVLGEITSLSFDG